MKKAIFSLLALLLLCLPASHALSVVTQCTPTAGTSCTLPVTPSVGNLMIAVAYRSNSATAPGTASGWTILKSTTGNTNSIKTGYKFSVGNETTCGVWSSATQTYCIVYDGAWIMSTWKTSGTTGSSTTLSYPAITLANPMSTSWVACASGGASATNVDQAPAGMTLRSGTTLGNLAYSDTNGAVSSWAAHTVTLSPTSLWASACFEIVGSPATSSLVPNYLVHSFNYGAANESIVAPYTTTLPVPPSLAGNHLALVFFWSYNTEPTVSNIYCNSDTGHATWTWTLGKQVADTSDQTDAYYYYIQGAAAGCTSVSVVASGAWTNAAFHFREFHNVTGVDTVVGQRTAYTTWLSAGTITPTVAGDVITQDCTSSSMAGPSGGSGSTYIFHSGGTQTLDAWRSYSMSSEGFVETGSGALTVTDNFVGFGSYGICIAAALKTGTAGTAPTPPYVLTHWNENMGSNVSTAVLQFSNLQAGDAGLWHGDGQEGANQVQWTGQSDTQGNSWTLFSPHDANGGYPNWALDCNVKAGDSIMTFTGTENTSDVNWTYNEIVGVDNSSHTACYDSAAGTPVGYVATGTTAANDPSITPSGSNEVVFAASEMGVGTPVGVTSPAGAVFGAATYSGQTDTSYMNLGNMFGYYITPNTATVNWGWDNGATNANPYQGSAIALKMASVAAPTRHWIWINQR